MVGGFSLRPQAGTSSLLLLLCLLARQFSSNAVVRLGLGMYMNVSQVEGRTKDGDGVVLWTQLHNCCQREMKKQPRGAGGPYNLCPSPYAT